MSLGLDAISLAPLGLQVETGGGGGGPPVLGVASESDSALPITANLVLGVGQPSTTGSALPITPLFTATIGLPATSGTALSITAAHRVVLGLPTETDSAQTISVSAPGTLGLQQEADAALPIAAAQARGTGLQVEADSALAIAARQLKTSGIASESDSALPISVLQPNVGLGLPQEGDQALPITVAGAASIGAGPDDAPARKRRWVVRNGDELLVFDSAAKAEEAQRSIDQWEARNAEARASQSTPRKRTTKSNPAPVNTFPAPQEAISVPYLRGLAVGYGMQAVYDQAIALRDLERAAALWQQLKAEEDEAEQMLLDDLDSLAPLVDEIVSQFKALKKRKKVMA